MYFATGVEPTNESAFTFGCVSRASTTSRPPWTMLNTPLGRPACSSSFAILMAVSGTFSLGFSTNVFPQTSATGYIQSGTIAGKLNGVIPTQTPSGWRMASQSMPRAMFSRTSPMRSEGMPQANSTISMPRFTSPRDSTSVLPCSRVLQRTMSSKFSSISILNRKKIRARSTGGVSIQFGNAAAAASIAAFTSATPPTGHSAMTSPMEGLNTGVPASFGSSHSPPIKKGHGCKVGFMNFL